MIFYFSGTGNSKWLAEIIAKNLNDETINIAEVEENRSYSFDADEKVGIVFPVYAWSPPTAVLDFVKKITINNTYTYAILSCGDDTGNAINKFNKIFPLNSGFSITMPNNYIIGSNVDSQLIIDEKIKNARFRLNQICNKIENKTEVFDTVEGCFSFIKTNVISFLFNKFGRSTKPFYVKTDSCISCGRCEQVCPSKTIKLKNSTPIWSKECFQCLACIHKCPERAIEYGKSTIEKRRYYLEKGIYFLKL